MNQLLKEDYPLLHLFKHQIEADKTGFYHRPYSIHKPSVHFYRSIFFSIGLIYTLLATVLFLKTLNWNSEYLFGSNLVVKSILLILCSAIGSSSLLMGLFMTPEKESVKKTIRKGRAKLQRSYSKKRIQHGLKSLFAFGEERVKSQAFNHHFHDILARLYEEQEECLLLLDRISRCKSLDSLAREELLNQALLELHRKIEGLVHVFETSAPGKRHFNWN